MLVLDLDKCELENHIYLLKLRKIQACMANECLMRITDYGYDGAYMPG